MSIERAKIARNVSGVILTQVINGVVYQQAHINEAKIIPEETITLDNGSLRLCAVVTFRGENVFHGHYFGFYCCRETWYKYDDIGGGTILPIGTYQQLLEFEEGYVLRRGISYFYC